MNRTCWWSLPEEKLLSQCGIDLYRASGPGGQKRNKTESAVRLRHQPTGVIVTASASRSQHENRCRALRRLREALAFEVRHPVHDDSLPAWFMDLCREGLRVPKRNERFLEASALVLDMLDFYQGEVSSAAKRLETTTSRLVAFLRTTTNLWKAAQTIRAAHQHRPLR